VQNTETKETIEISILFHHFYHQYYFNLLGWEHWCMKILCNWRNILIMLKYTFWKG